jgi:hypothetical protein
VEKFCLSQPGTVGVRCAETRDAARHVTIHKIGPIMNSYLFSMSTVPGLTNLILKI